MSNSAKQGICAYTSNNKQPAAICTATLNKYMLNMDMHNLSSIINKLFASLQPAFNNQPSTINYQHSIFLQPGHLQQSSLPE